MFQINTTVFIEFYPENLQSIFLRPFGIAFAFGLAIVVAAYSIGTVSGAHLNPAVSIAMFVNKRLSSKELVNYILG